MRFLDELKRRKVVRVAVVYAATGLAILQAANRLREAGSDPSSLRGMPRLRAGRPDPVPGGGDL